MIDHLLGRPSTRLKRLQVCAVIVFWLAVLRRTDRRGPNVRVLRWCTRRAQRYSPWQLTVAVLTAVYALRHADAILGVAAPEPLARMYSRPFYRVTWIVTALDAGFASAMHLRPAWLRDAASVVFSLYYLIYADEADEKLRKYRAFCTVGMLRATWHKTDNPYLRALTRLTWHRPRMVQKLLLPRPELGAHATRPVQVWLFYDGTDADLRHEQQLLLDIPGGGYISMTPQHHEERLRQLAKETRRPVLAVDYGKAPEHPFPYALEECFDVYRSLQESRGRIIGMSSSSSTSTAEAFGILLCGDSAGGNLACGVTLKIIEYPQPHIRSAYARRASGGPGSAPPPLARPIGLLLAYPSLNFAFTSWIKPEFLRVLRQQSEMNLHSMATPAETAGRLAAASSPLNPAARSQPARPTSAERRASVATPPPGSALATGGDTGSGAGESKAVRQHDMRADRSFSSLAAQAELHLAERARFAEAEPATSDDQQSISGEEQGDNEEATPVSAAVWSRIESDELDTLRTECPDLHRSASMDRARMEHAERQRQLNEFARAEDSDREARKVHKAPINTRLTMTSMAGYFQDRIITQSMLRAMAILYIGPRKQPDFDHDYMLSPLIAPPRLLAEFPPTLFICGEKDPLCDDTVVMAGRIREAKVAKKADLERRRAGRSARFGEALRMSQGGATARAQKQQRDPIEDEDVSETVQMRIIEGWSHGFLQMSSLLPEAKQVITFLSTWVVETFEVHAEQTAAAQQAAPPLACPPLPSPVSSRAGPSAPLMHRARKGHAAVVPPSAPASTAVAAAGDPHQADDADDEEPLSFIPKSTRSPSSSMRGSPVPKPVQFAAATCRTAEATPSAASVNARAYSQESNPLVFPPSAALSSSNGGGGVSLVLAPPPESLKDGHAAAANGRQVASEMGDVCSNSNSLRRGSKTGMTTEAEERYKSLLVNEHSLLQRRRDEAVFGLGETASGLHSSDDEQGDDTGRCATAGSGRRAH
ncbi:alpha/beta-hydrolase [Tilletiaria anomala UBC 951]|uniref:Alpha/beta-hydrolase n=1 Tax=Tilletiaria anomala (strain ATCC 24038 / CBS 436.72 / UBC 951) TaxID=1037660 RepID=A0A066VKP2_TILAU|nr:alpha/beta-hydrolase [Tilletiaria anomala UBC 951]KDN42061.1 alpha/beta-hydrolase [Tilletiaria anomala UBC 951]